MNSSKYLAIDGDNGETTWALKKAFMGGVAAFTEINPRDVLLTETEDESAPKQSKQEVDTETNISPVANPKSTNASFDIRAKHFVFIDAKHPTAAKLPHPETLAAVHALASKLQPKIDCKNLNYTFNANRTDEVFLPVFVTTQDGTQSAMYVHPSLSGFGSSAKKETTRCNNLSFSGFKKFHTVFCIYGARLQAVDTKSNTFSLIKHDWQQLLYKGQKITDIVAPKKFSLYEEMSFAELEQICAFINTHTAPKHAKDLDIHLPGPDYILFALQLFIKNKIEYAAFIKLISVILKRQELLVGKISDICKKSGVKVNIISPFENLFGKIPQVTGLDEKKVKEIIESILKTLGFKHPLKDYKDYFEKNTIKNEEKSILESIESILNSLGVNKPSKENLAKKLKETNEEEKAKEKPTGEVDETPKEAAAEKRQDEDIAREIVEAIVEDVLVKSFLEKLTTNTYNQEQNIAWQMLGNTNGGKITTFESLFKFANVIPLACASEAAQDFETCFIASQTEKQIWLEYDKMLKGLSKLSNIKHPFKQIFSASLIDPIVATSAVNNKQYHGMPYYYTSPHEDALIHFIKSGNIIPKMYKNVALFANESLRSTQNNCLNESHEEKPLTLKAHLGLNLAKK